MQNDSIRVFFIGDIIGRYGRYFLSKALLPLKRKYKPNLIIANGENSAGGLGIIKKTADEIFNAGVDIITTGNHVWDKKEALPLLKENKFILRPVNFPDVVPGNGFLEFSLKDGEKVTIINLQGRVFMEPVVDNPFNAIDRLLKRVDTKIVFVDFHAEATAEKQAMGFYLDGRVSAVIGTHTHVQTTDYRVLSNGTAYQTDVGMTGSLDSIIGMKRQPIIQRFLTGINQRFEVAKANQILDIAIIDINTKIGKAEKIVSKRLYESNFQTEFKDYI